MPKNKRPVPRKSSSLPEEDDDLMAQALADLALDIVEREESDPALLRQQEDNFNKLVRNALRKKNDEVLYGAIERARYADVGAYQYLREHVEEASATVTLRRDGVPAMEIHAFLVPLFVHSKGGLKEAETFQDDAAFALLVESFQQAGLESPQARVVLISHAYDLAEIDSITYSHLNDMLRDAAASMTDKKIVATPAIERSIGGWSERSFESADEAMELRFLLGFVLKRADDPFYIVPAGETEADDYFAARMERYRDWTIEAAPLVQSCLASDPTTLELSFMYQDLFYGAKQQGMDELAMLGMMSELNQALADHSLAPDAVRAIIAPADVHDEMVLRVNLVRAEGGALLASSEQPLDLAADLQTEVDDVCDALATIGIHAVSVAQRFNPDGSAEQERVYQPDQGDAGQVPVRPLH